MDAGGLGVLGSGGVATIVELSADGSDFEALGGWARENGLSFNNTADLIEKAEVIHMFDNLLVDVNKDLPGFNQIKKCSLLDREFTLDDGELTPTMKVKRFAIGKKYKAVIDRMYPEPLAGEED